MSRRVRGVIVLGCPSDGGEEPDLDLSGLEENAVDEEV